MVRRTARGAAGTREAILMPNSKLLLTVKHAVTQRVWEAYWVQTDGRTEKGRKKTSEQQKENKWRFINMHQ